MPTRFANTIDNDPIYALRAMCDKNGLDFTQFYAKLADLPDPQVQADWNISDPTSKAFIKNKPDLSVFALSSSLATVATSGSYNDLLNKPTIPAAQVQSDYGQADSSAVDFIKNKPDLSVYARSSDLAEVATTGDYDDLLNKPSIPAAQVQSDWSQSDSSAVDYIKNKPQNLVQDADYVHTDNNYTDTDEAKLAGIEAGAEVNVQADWNQSDSSADDFIKNKPSIPVVDQTYSGVSANAQSGVSIQNELTAHYQRKIVIIDYNTATWAGVSAAFNTDSLIFLKDGSKYAILTYVFSSFFEFQYIQNTNETPWKQSKGAVLWKYSLNTNSSWTVTTSPLAFTPLGGVGIKLSSEYSDRSVTFDVDIPVYTSGSNSLLFLGSNGLLVKSSAFSNTTVTNTFLSDRGGLGVYAKSYTGNTNRSIGNQYSANFSDSLTKETATIGFVGGTAVSMTFNANNVVKWDSSSAISVAVGTGLAIKYGLFSISPKSITTSGNYAFALNLEPIKILDFGTVGTIAEGTTSLTTTPTVYAPASFNNITIEKGAKLATMFYSEVGGVKYFYVNTRNPYGNTTISIVYDRTTSAAAIVEEAPSDGKEYVRKNGAWESSETVLWSSSDGNGVSSCVLSESPTNFERIKVLVGTNSSSTVKDYLTWAETTGDFTSLHVVRGKGSSNVWMSWIRMIFDLPTLTLTVVASKSWKFGTASATTWSEPTISNDNAEDISSIVKVIGINRIASN